MKNQFRMSEGMKSLLHAFKLPLVWVALLWLIEGVQIYLDTSFIPYGVYPLTLSGLKGVFLAAFIHKDVDHLISNSFPILLLAAALFHYYKPIAFRSLFWMYIGSGLTLWFIARPAYHIGASTLVYALAFFLFSSGLIRKHRPLMSLSLLIAFYYGGMIWGLFPIEEGVSWEGHVSGAAVGGVLAVLYRNKGPQRPKYDWEEEQKEEDVMDQIL